MKKILLPFLLLLAAAVTVAAQSAKRTPLARNQNQGPQELKVNWPDKVSVPPAENPFGLPTDVQRDPLPAFVPLKGTKVPDVRIIRGENGLPILFEGKTDASTGAKDANGALSYLASLRPTDIAEPMTEFVAKSTETDQFGNIHTRLEQVYQGVPVFGGEVIAHTRDGAFALLNGRYFPTPQLSSVVPAVDATSAIEKVKAHIGIEKIKTNWTAADLALFKIEPFKAELVVYHRDNQLDNERLAWHIEAHPNLLSRLIYFVDAQTGEVIHHYDYTCKIDGGRHSAVGSSSEQHTACSTHFDQQTVPSHLQTANRTLLPPVTGTGIDLLGQNRSFGAWQQGGTYYLEDASKSMFNSAASTMPGDPVGVIVSLNALNNSPESQNFDYTIFTAGSTNFSGSATGNGAKAVSTHWNSIKSFDYFKSTFNRNSIDGVGGNILAFFNVAELNAGGNPVSMENAFWNGSAMWYGNGGSTFKELARGLDVGGHEMTHGVVEKTANLVYQDESGALNESFADIFGAMIDRDDWKMGEDVMQPGASPSGALRDLSNPANGDTPGGGNNLGGDFWQPSHVNQKYTGTQDNGGVHKNSGIPNRAFYLFASNAAVGKEKAEQVFYKALKDYLVKSSIFVDLRIAVLQAATELYGSTVANAAASAFDQVGILGSSPGGNYLGQLAVNPGTDYVLCVTNNSQNLEVRNGNGQLISTIYTQGVKSRPSVTDNGSQVVFVNTAGDAIYVDLVYNGGTVQATSNVLITDPDLDNVVISKTGFHVAALTSVADEYIYVLDLFNSDQEAFKLYNPTYSTGQETGDVQYADVLEFDYSGNYIMYDAFNELTSTTSEDISYWDIGFLEFRKNGVFTDGDNAFISKLFSGLPEKASIGNPAFSKNSPYIIAFDFIDGIANKYSIYGANVETGDYNTIVADNFGATGWPTYNRLDNTLVYEGPDNGVTNIYRRALAADKISSAGDELGFIADRQWAVPYANGNRSLTVGSNEPASAPFSVSVSPNPVTDFARVNIESKIASPVQLSVVNLLGVTVQTREANLVAGENQLDLNLQQMPAGTYIVRLFSGNSGMAVKVVKQ